MNRRGWCEQCDGIVPVARNVLRPRWIDKPGHWDFGNFVEVELCQDGHALRELCDTCGKLPARDGVDSCLLCWPTDCDEPVEFRRDLQQPVRVLLADHDRECPSFDDGECDCDERRDREGPCPPDGALGLGA